METETQDGALLATARQLAASGLSLVPIGLDGTKRPAVAWKRYQSAPATDADLARWFTGDRHGIGVIAGRVSGYLEIGDLDDAELWAPWTGLVEREIPGLIGRLVIVRTPRPGYQVWYRCPAGIQGNQKLARKQAGVDKAGNPILFTQIETRGEGGYAVAPGSPPSVHETGRPYEVLQGDLAALPEISAEERACLLECAQALNSWVEPDRRPQRAPAARLADGSRPGDDYNARGDWSALLTRHGWTVTGQHGQVLYCRRPGKVCGHSATLHAVAPGMFYVFSSNAAPFESEGSYDLFGAFARLEHRGDFHAAARALAEQGYGTPAPRIHLSGNGKAPPAAPAELAALLETVRRDRDPAPVYRNATLLAQLAKAEYALAVDALKTILGPRLDKNLLAAAVKEARAPAPPPQTDPDLPVIRVDNRPLRDISDDALTALHAANTPPELFVRMGALARVRADENDRPIIDQVDEAHLRGRLTRVANFITALAHTDPSRFLVQDLIALGTWPFPALRGVVEVPTLRPDGSVILAAGYDAATGLYYRPAEGLLVPHVSAKPTATDREDALALIDEAIGDFPYVDAAARANLLALLLTPILRPALTGHVPLALLDKPKAGTGASLLAEVVATVTTGRPAAMMGAPDDEAEWEKAITATLLSGATVITIDNVTHPLASGQLSRALTAKTWQSRILGASENALIPVQATWIATGNNIRLGGDIPRRCYRIRLDAECSRPWDRTGPDPETPFRHPELLPWVQEHRGELLGALLTLVRAWYAAGCPKADVPVLGNFGHWCRTAGGILTHAGKDGFLGNLEAMYEESDDEGAEWEAFLAAWNAQIGDKEVTTAQIVFELTAAPAFCEALPGPLAAAHADPTRFSVRLAAALRARLGAYYGSEGFHLVKGARDTHRAAPTWKVLGTRKAA